MSVCESIGRQSISNRFDRFDRLSEEGTPCEQAHASSMPACLSPAPLVLHPYTYTQALTTTSRMGLFFLSAIVPPGCFDLSIDDDVMVMCECQMPANWVGSMTINGDRWASGEGGRIRAVRRLAHASMVVVLDSSSGASPITGESVDAFPNQSLPPNASNVPRGVACSPAVKQEERTTKGLGKQQLQRCNNNAQSNGGSPPSNRPAAVSNGPATASHPLLAAATGGPSVATASERHALRGREGRNEGDGGLRRVVLGKR